MKVITTPSPAYHAIRDIACHAGSDNKSNATFMERAAATGMRVHVLAAASTTVAVLLAVAGAGEPAWGAVDLDAVINMDVDFAQFRTTYSDRIEYEYGEGSLLHQHLGGRQWVVEGTASEGQDVQNLEDMLNDKITSNTGSPKLSVSDVGYEFRLEPTGYGSTMERTVWITGNLTGYMASAAVMDISTDYAMPALEGNAPAGSLGTRQAWVAYATETCTNTVPDTVVDRWWLSPTVTGDIVIGGVPINIPASLLREMEPEAYGLLAGTEADAILNRPLMDAGAIRLYADTWHSRHYPAGTNVDADTFGLSVGVMDVDVHTWTADVDNPENGTKGADCRHFSGDTCLDADGPWFWTNGAYEVAITLDQTYVIRITHDTSSATIRTIGTGVFDNRVVADSIQEPWCPPKVDVGHSSQIMSTFIALILVAIIAWLLIGARRRDRRLQRSDGGRQSAAGAPP